MVIVHPSPPLRTVETFPHTTHKAIPAINPIFSNPKPRRTTLLVEKIRV